MEEISLGRKIVYQNTPEHILKYIQQHKSTVLMKKTDLYHTIRNIFSIQIQRNSNLLPLLVKIIVYSSIRDCHHDNQDAK